MNVDALSRKFERRPAIPLDEEQQKHLKRSPLKRSATPDFRLQEPLHQPNFEIQPHLHRPVQPIERPASALGRQPRFEMEREVRNTQPLRHSNPRVIDDEEESNIEKLL